MSRRTFAFLFSVLVSTSAFANGRPGNSVFDAIASAAKQEGFWGYDVLVCKTKFSGSLRLGGLTSWNSLLQILVLNEQSELVPAHRAAGEVDELDKAKNYKWGSESLKLVLSMPKANTKGLPDFEGFLQIGNKEIAEKLNCWIRRSGLE